MAVGPGNNQNELKNEINNLRSGGRLEISNDATGRASPVLKRVSQQQKTWDQSSPGLLRSAGLAVESWDSNFGFLIPRPGLMMSGNSQKKLI